MKFVYQRVGESGWYWKLVDARGDAIATSRICNSLAELVGTIMLVKLAKDAKLERGDDE